MLRFVEIGVNPLAEEEDANDSIRKFEVPLETAKGLARLLA